MNNDWVNIVEVGARDGLQNEATQLSVNQRLQLIEKLSQTGLTTIEAGAFVSPKWVPQMAGSDEVLSQALTNQTFDHLNLPVLTPNRKGFEAAKAAGAKEIAIFGAASETFSQRNINCTVEESLARFRDFVGEALEEGIRVRGYVSCLVACPYEGWITPQQVVPVVRELFNMGCYEVSLGDTIGRGTPKRVQAVLQALLTEFKPEQLAMHFHDTYGMAIANVMAGLDLGLRTIDASVGGAGGCPYAQGASGNVATEDVVYLLEQQGLRSNVNLDALVETGAWLFELLGKPAPSKVHQALLGK